MCHIFPKWVSLSGHSLLSGIRNHLQTAPCPESKKSSFPKDARTGLSLFKTCSLRLDETWVEVSSTSIMAFLTQPNMASTVALLRMISSFSIDS